MILLYLFSECAFCFSDVKTILGGNEPELASVVMEWTHQKIVVILMFCLSKNSFYGGLQRDPVLHFGGRVRLILKTLDAEFVNFAIMFV